MSADAAAARPLALARRPVGLALLGVGALAAAGCSTTQEKSAALAARAPKVAGIGSESLGRPTAGVRVVRTTLIRGSDAGAAVVEVRNATRRAITRLPIGLTVSAGRTAVYTNRTDGLDARLLRLAALRPGERLLWVNDQLPKPAGRERVRAAIGAGRPVAARRVPRMSVGRLSTGRDAGQATVSGTVANRGRVTQTRLIAFVTAERDGRVVAAGTAEIARLTRGSRRSFVAYLVGDPAGARIRAVVPPTVLQP